MQYFSHKKIEIRESVIFVVIRFVRLKLPWIFLSQKLVRTYYQCLAHNRSYKPFIPPHFDTQDQDICHGTIDYDLIKIECQDDFTL